MPQVTIQQLERGLELADKAGDVQAAKAFSAELANALGMSADTPGIPRSTGRGAVGGTLGLMDFILNLTAIPGNAIADYFDVPRVRGHSNAAQRAQEQLNLPPPVTAGERAAELLGSTLVPGGIATKAAAKAGRFIPVLAAEGASLGGSIIGREAGVQAGGPGSIAEVVGTVAGGFTPAGLGALSKGLSAPQLPYRSRKGQEQALSAFERQNIPPTVADVTDQAFTQKMLGKIPGAHGVEKGVRQGQQDAMESAVARLAPDADDVTAGQAIHKGIQGYVTDVFKPTAAKLSKRLDAKVPKNTPVEVPNTQALFAKIREEKGPFQGSLGVPAITKMESELKKAVEAAKPGFDLGPALRGEKRTQEILDFKTLRRMRSAIGHKLASVDLVSEIPRADLKQLYGAMSKDIWVAAKAAGEDAERSLARLNSYWKKGIDRVDNFLEPLSKKITPEDAYSALVRSAKSSPTRIAHLSKALKPEERELVLSAMLRKMGNPTPGVGSLDYTFSPETFLTSLNKIDERNFAKLARGTRYQESSDLKDLRLVAGRLREVDRVLKNPSGTGEALMSSGTTLAALGTTAGAIAGSSTSLGLLGIIGAGAGGSYTLSKLLANPKFVNWVVRGEKLGPSQYVSHLARLTTVMEGEPDDDRIAVGKFIERYMEMEQSE